MIIITSIIYVSKEKVLLIKKYFISLHVLLAFKGFFICRLKVMFLRYRIYYRMNVTGIWVAKLVKKRLLDRES